MRLIFGIAECSVLISVSFPPFAACPEHVEGSTINYQLSTIFRAPGAAIPDHPRPIAHHLAQHRSPRHIRSIAANSLCPREPVLALILEPTCRSKNTSFSSFSTNASTMAGLFGAGRSFQFGRLAGWIFAGITPPARHRVCGSDTGGASSPRDLTKSL